MSRLGTVVVLFALLVASVAGMIGLLRPSVFPLLGGRAEDPVASVRQDASALGEEPSAGMPLPDGTTPGPTDQETPAPEENEPAAYRLYVVLDDAGHDLGHLRAFVPFPGVFTVAVLPGLEFSRESLRMTIALGHEAILHQPMEAMGEHDPGPGAILTSHSDAEIRRTLVSNLASMPGVVGVNNHMGSRATSDPRVMRTVADTLTRYRLFFLDSRTTHLSIAAQVSRQVGLGTLERDVFLDNIRSEAAISAQLDAALEVARRQGYAVLIGHVTSPELARVLISRYSELQAAGFTFLPLSDLLERSAHRVTHADTRN